MKILYKSQQPMNFLFKVRQRNVAENGLILLVDVLENDSE